MAHGGAREGKWRGNMRMEWVASNLALYRKTVYPALLLLMRMHQLPAADWTETPADLNGLVRFAGRPNLVSACVPSRFERALPQVSKYREINKKAAWWKCSWKIFRSTSSSENYTRKEKAYVHYKMAWSRSRNKELASRPQKKVNCVCLQEQPLLKWGDRWVHVASWTLLK